MDEKHIGQHIEELIEYVKQGAEFAERQAPLVAEEIVQYEFWSAVAAMGISAFLFVTVLGLVWSVTSGLPPDDGDRLWSRVVISVVGGIVVLLVWCINALSLMKAIVAPRMVILDYIKSLM